MLDTTRNIVRIAEKHKVLVVSTALAVTAPTVVMAAPELYDQVAALPAQARYAVGGVTIVLAGAALAALGRRSGEMLTRICRQVEELAQRRQDAAAARKRARLWKACFKLGQAPGSEKVVLLERAGGNIANLSRQPSGLPMPLLRELGVARRTVLAVPDASPGVEVDAPPELLPSEAGELMAAFPKSPVRDDIGDAVRRTQMWLPHQEPALASFLNGCEPQVGIHIWSLGASSLTDGLHGLGSRVRGSERNFHVYIADYPRVKQTAEPQRREDPEVPFPDDPDLVPALAFNTARPMAYRSTGVADSRDLDEQMLDMEGEFGDLAGLHGDLVFLVSNVEGVKEDRMTRTDLDIMASASLRNYQPLGDVAGVTGPAYADVTHRHRRHPCCHGDRQGSRQGSVADPVRRL